MTFVSCIGSATSILQALSDLQDGNVLDVTYSTLIRRPRPCIYAIARGGGACVTRL